MGKVRVKTFGDQEEEKKQERLKQRRAEAKEVKKAAASKSSEEKVESKEASPANLEELISPTMAAQDENAVAKPKPKKKDKFVKATRSQNYKTVAENVDVKKVYKLSEAVSLLPKLKRAKFDETVELHINTTEQGVSGSITLPHGTGKKTRVAIATDALIAEVEKGVINFDILVAEPMMMAKLAKVARILGPRGLMPNPKNGTVTPKPEDVAKKYEGGLINFKTEAKAPILHVTVGKVSFGDEKLKENIKAFAAAINTAKMRNMTLKSTMSPGIKVDLASL